MHTELVFKKQKAQLLLRPEARSLKPLARAPRSHLKGYSSRR